MKIDIKARRSGDAPEAAPVPSQVALPGRGGLLRIWKALGNSLRGLQHGAATEAAIKQELAVIALALPVSFFLASSVLQWIALVGCLALMLAAEFLNTAVERFCNHVTPSRHNAIRDTKDLASAGVFVTQTFAAIVWIAVAAERLGLVG